MVLMKCWFELNPPCNPFSLKTVPRGVVKRLRIENQEKKNSFLTTFWWIPFLAVSKTSSKTSFFHNFIRRHFLASKTGMFFDAKEWGRKRLWKRDLAPRNFFGNYFIQDISQTRYFCHRHPKLHRTPARSRSQAQNSPQLWTFSKAVG